MVKEALGAQGVACVIGGSMGGCQALEWAIMTSEEDVVGNASTITGNQSADYSNSNDNSNNSSTTTETCSGDSSDGSTSVSNVGTSGKKPFLRSAIVIGCGECHSGWQIGFQEAQRQAIYADPKWNNGDVDMNDPPISGLAVARQIGMISYRTHGAFTKKFGREIDEKSDKYQVRRYLEYQGHKFLSRFDPVSYLKLTEQLDSHDVGRSRGGADKALASILQRILVIGISSDILYPLIEQKELCEKISGSEMRVVNSSDGHDGFLLEQDQVGGHIQEFLDSLES
jgi:homoserine O-acetyltransferase